MEARRVKPFSKDHSVCGDLLRGSFPAEERLPSWVLALMSLRREVDYLSFREGGEFCGFAYTSSAGGTLYVLYLAVPERVRSKGYGAKILSHLVESNPGKNVVLNVEPPDETADNNEQRRRRIGFYARNGFRDTGFRMVDSTGEYLILSTGELFCSEDYERAISKVGLGFFGARVLSRPAKRFFGDGRGGSFR